MAWRSIRPNRSSVHAVQTSQTTDPPTHSQNAMGTSFPQFHDVGAGPAVSSVLTGDEEAAVTVIDSAALVVAGRRSGSLCASTEERASRTMSGTWGRGSTTPSAHSNRATCGSGRGSGLTGAGTSVTGRDG